MSDTRKHYTLTAKDVGKPSIKAFGRTWMCSEFIGRVLPGDVGKRVYYVGSDAGDRGILQVENDEQRDARVKRPTNNSAGLPHVVRYVPTYINRDGMRTLIRAAQGRNTFDTAEAAQKWINAVTGNNSAETIRQVYGDNPRFEVRPCACWPNHFDPIGVYFD